MLAAGPTECLQGKSLAVPAFLERHLPDGLGHVRNGNPEGTVSDFLRRARYSAFLGYALCELCKLLADAFSIKALVLLWAKTAGK